MIKINIKKNNKVKVKSFVEKKDLENYLFELTVASNPKSLADNPTNKIWNLNVGHFILIFRLYYFNCW